MTTTVPPTSASKAILAALRDLGTASPSEVVEWYERTYGEPPAQTEGTFRNAFTRLRDQGKVVSVPDLYGYYRLPRENTGLHQNDGKNVEELGENPRDGDIEGTNDYPHRSTPSTHTDTRYLEARAHYIGRALVPTDRAAVPTRTLNAMVRETYATPYATLFAVDSELRYTRVEGDEHIIALAGYTKEEILGHRLDEVLKPKHAASVEPLFRAALDGHSDAITQSYGGVAFAVAFYPAEHDDERYAACLAIPLSGAYSEGREERARIPVLEFSGDYDFGVEMVISASRPLRSSVSARRP